MGLGILSLILLFIMVPLSREGLAEIPDRKGRIGGASHVNLRSGPGISHPPVSILKDGEEVDIGRLEGSWYRVSLPDGRSGYVYKELLYLVSTQEMDLAKEAVPEQETEAPKEIPVTETDAGEEDSSEPFPHHVEIQISPPQLAEGETPKSNTLPPIETGRRGLWQTSRWLVVALCIFILGWICGGNFYLRRDRIRRTTLRF